MTTLDLGTTQTKHGPPILKRIEAVKSPRMVEIGVLRGKLSHYLLERKNDLMLWMVDPWRELKVGTPGRDFADQTGEPCGKLTQAQHDDNRAMACAVADFYAGRAVVAATDSLSASILYGSACFDMVFIDGGHWREQVEADLSAWWPLVKPGGWIGGHDYNVPGIGADVPAGVDPFFARIGLHVELDDFYTWFVRKPREVKNAA